jgi:hypothetical protein
LIILSSQEESDWFGAEYYDAEIPSSVKFGFGLGAGMAIFQVVVIVSAVGLGLILNKE